MGIANLIATIADATSSTTKKAMSSFSFLETSDGHNTIVGKDGSLMSIIKVDGVKHVMGRDELNHIIESLSLKMSSYLAHPGHAIQIWFTRDPDLAPQMIKRQLEVPRATASALNLELDDVFSERERHLPKFVVYESFHIALWTRLTSLTKPERERAKIESKPPKGWPTMADAQDVFRAAKPLIDRHDSFVHSFMNDLGGEDIRAEVLNSHDAIRAVKWSIYPDLIDADWKPTLYKDNTPMREPEIATGDASHLLWPRLDDQIFHQEAERINPRIVRIGSRYFAGVDMTVGPQEIMPFSSLLGRMISGNEFPWRASFLLEGDGLAHLGIKSFLAGIFQFTNSENRAIREAIKGLQEQRTMESMVVAKMRVSFATWAPADDLMKAEERSSMLQRAVEGWGHCNVSATAGDPLAGVLSSSLGLSPSSTAPSGAAPLSDATAMLPLDRDASPWPNGSIMFRTPDGRMWPYAPGSSLQDTFIDLIFAPPGKGKSVWLNSSNLALALSPLSTQGTGGVKLPQIAIIDIGPSSSGLISLLKESLPPDRRYEVEYRRLRMDKSNAINPFDTQLGCRKPFPVEKSFIVNFLTAIGTEPGSAAPPAGLSNIAMFCVDELYKHFSDLEPKSQPKKYIEGMDIAVDEAIRKHNIHIMDDTFWWDLVDEFFRKGDLHAASLAQRFAVPMIEDLGIVLNMGKIRDIFGTTVANAGGELTLDLFQRMYLSALKEYSILTVATRFDIGQSRIVALDLDEVAPRGSGPAEKQTALMYMLARFVLAKDFYLNVDLLDQVDDGRPLIPDLYREHHMKRIYRIRETPKRLVYDEFHRTAGSEAVRSQVLVDIREGRKWGVHIALASQLLDDFDKNMVDMASGVWIMGVGNERNAREAAQIFGLSDTAQEIMNRRLTGPSSVGAPFLAVLFLKSGRHEHLLYNSIGPTEIWAFSTTAEDTALRNRLYQRLGAVEARRRLAKVFRNGSAKKEIERRLEIQMEQGKVGDAAANGVISDLFKEIVSMRTD